MNKETKLGLLITLLSSDAFNKVTPILEYFHSVLQQPEYVLPIKAYNRIASNYYLSGIPKADYPHVVLESKLVKTIFSHDTNAQTKALEQGDHFLLAQGLYYSYHA